MRGWLLMAGAWLLAAAGTLRAQEACQQLVATGPGTLAPYLWRDQQQPGHLSGAAAEALRALLAPLEIQSHLLYAGSPGKALQAVQAGRFDLWLGEAGLTGLHTLEPALLAEPVVAWVRKDEGFHWSHWDELRGLKGGWLSDQPLSPAFSRFVTGQQLLVQSFEGWPQALDALFSGQVDYLLAGQRGSRQRWQQLGVSDELDRLEPPLFDSGLHLAISLNSACDSPALREQLSAGLQRRAVGERPDKPAEREPVPDSTDSEPLP